MHFICNLFWCVLKTILMTCSDNILIFFYAGRWSQEWARLEWVWTASTYRQHGPSRSPFTRTLIVLTHISWHWLPSGVNLFHMTLPTRLKQVVMTALPSNVAVSHSKTSIQTVIPSESRTMTHFTGKWKKFVKNMCDPALPQGLVAH